MAIQIRPIARYSAKKILRANSYEKHSSGKYRDPVTRRLVSEKTALDRSAVKSGFKNIQDYKKARKDKTYRYFEDWAKKKGFDPVLGEKFSKLYAAWRKVKFERKSPEMRDILQQFDWLDDDNYHRYTD